MEQLGAIEKVDQPTEWVNSIVIVEKEDGSLRICLDPKDLNRAVKREHFTGKSSVLNNTESGINLHDIRVTTTLTGCNYNITPILR